MIHTPAQTMTKANNVPMLTISVSTSMGRDAASTATNTPTVSVEIQGVRKRGWTALNRAGNKRSRDMEKNTRDCPSSMTTISLLAVGFSFAKVGRGMVGALKFLQNYDFVDFSKTCTKI